MENLGDYFSITLYDLLYSESMYAPAPVVAGEETVERLIVRLCSEGPKSRAELQEASGISSRTFFIKRYLTPLIEKGAIEPLGPKNSPTQKYRAVKHDGR